MHITKQADVWAAPPGRHNAGTNLYLIVSKDGQWRRWAFRYIKPSTGKPTEMGLGSAELITLAEAQDKAFEHCRTVAKGNDPIEEKRKQKRLQITFAEMASAYITIMRPSWRSESYYSTMRRLLNLYASSLATKTISTITSDEIETAVRPFWNRSVVTGKHTLDAIRQVFDLAMAKGHCTTNPADWRLMKRRFPYRHKVKHFNAMIYREVPSFFVPELRSRQQRDAALSPYVIEFLLLTVCQANEVCRMKWDEINFQAKVWTVPASRTKADREHRVPLCDRALELLEQRRQNSKSNYVWTSRKGRPITGKAIYLYLVGVMRIKATIHGFRSTFRD